MSFIFSAAFMANTFSMTGLLIMLSLLGESVFAADVGIVQAATLALFYAFSGNARNLILNQHSVVTAESILGNRLILLIPLALTAYWLSSVMADVDPILASILILRRAIEWFDEVYLSDLERSNIKKSAFQYIFIQILLLFIGLLWLFLKLPYPLFGLLMWALLPLVFSIKFYIQKTPSLTEIVTVGISKKILPHLGSTMIIGVAVYIFRLMIVMSTGKSTAGDLFTAFAIGGVLGSVFANAIGPSLALHQKSNLNYKMPIMIKLLLIAFSCSGLILVLVSTIETDLFKLSLNTQLFWMATGLSMIAGSIMVFAQMIRHRLLQHHQEQDLFGPDVIMNILIIAAVPFGYSLFGLKMMAGLYLLSASFAYLFYASYEFGEVLHSSISPSALNKFKIAVATMLISPIFFQIDGGIFNDATVFFDSEHKLVLLPIPLSILACFLGVLFLANYQQAKLAFIFIFTTFILMTFSTIMTTGQDAALEESKFILLMQFILPMFGLVLGQFFCGAVDKFTYLDLAKTFLYVLLVFLPLQLVSTWAQGYYFLSPYLYFMSIYQHLEYVPIIFVSAYLIALFKLWEVPKYQAYIIFISALMSVYVIATLSMLVTFMFYAGICVFILQEYNQNKKRKLVKLFTLALLTSMIYFYGFINPNVNNESFISRQEVVEKNDVNNTQSILLVNSQQRVSQWEYYLNSFKADSESMLLGHRVIPNREVHPSAYNYYLDFVYSFGFLSIAPLFLLIFYTFKQLVSLYRHEGSSVKKEAPIVLVLSGIVFFLVIIFNQFNVSLRQPYSGLFTFFIWGLLINKITSNFININEVQNDI